MKFFKGLLITNIIILILIVPTLFVLDNYLAKNSKAPNKSSLPHRI